VSATTPLDDRRRPASGLEPAGVPDHGVQHEAATAGLISGRAAGAAAAAADVRAVPAWLGGDESAPAGAGAELRTFRSRSS
jgi:hypothetical protein